MPTADLPPEPTLAVETAGSAEEEATGLVSKADGAEAKEERAGGCHVDAAGASDILPTSVVHWAHALNLTFTPETAANCTITEVS